jgi:UDP-glucose 4-epimerase
VESVVVTGGLGFIGNHLTRKLLRFSKNKIKKVIVIDNSNKLNKGRISDIEELSDGKRLTVYREDVRDKGGVSDILRSEKPVDTFVHLAAWSNIHDPNIDSHEITDVNANGTTSVLDASSTHNVKRFIFASSAAVYGEARRLPLAEDHQLLPLSTYGLSKARAEGLVTSYTLSGKIQSSASIRIFNAYGEGDRKGVIYKFSERLASGLPPSINGDGSQVRDFISVTDVIEAILLASTSREVGEFNVGTGIPVTINALARKMIRIYGVDVEPEYCTEYEEKNLEHNITEIRQSYADTRKSASLLHFTARNSINSELKLIREKSLT